TGTSWRLERSLQRAVPNRNQLFGQRVATTRLGDRLFIQRVGNIAVYRRSGSTYTLETEVDPVGRGTSVGEGLAVDESGLWLAAGAPDYNGEEASAGILDTYQRLGSSWSRQATFRRGGARADDRLGDAVAIDGTGTRVIVGAGEDYVAAGSTSRRGRARVYRRAATGWVPEVAFSDGATFNTGFGEAVAFDDDADRAFVGARDDRVPGPPSVVGAGRVFVYRRTGTSWIREASLAATAPGANDNFGTSVAANRDGDRFVAGAPFDDTAAGMNAGSARVFRRTGTAWVQEAEIRAMGAAADRQFGRAVAMSDDGVRVLVGGGGGSRGGAQVFARSGTTWVHEATFDGSSTTGSSFGAEVALSGDGTRAFVGAPQRSGGGAVFEYLRTGTSWVFQGEIRPRGSAPANEFGDALATDRTGSRLLAGNDPRLSQAVRLYVRTGTTWRISGTLDDPDAEVGEELGFDVALSGDGARAILGNPGSDRLGTDAGEAVVFTLDDELGSACTTNADCPMTGASTCVDGVCCEAACSGQCEACDVPGSEGLCTAVEGAPRGTRTSCTGSGACAGTCDGTNRMACTFPGTGVLCRDARCSGTGEFPARFCSGAGTCVSTPSVACGDFICAGRECVDVCARNLDCVGDNRCIDGACVPPLADGEACIDRGECASGFCTDGVCCASACGDQCEACAEAGMEGTCVAVTGIPRSLRADCGGGAGLCGLACDGIVRDRCVVPGSTVVCRPASCAGGVATFEAACDGAGSCPALATADCAPFDCDAEGVACATTCDDDRACALGNFCDVDVCVPLRDLGVACTRAGECASGSCVDGVCCDGVCGGQCEGCAEAGSLGTCVAVTGDPVGGRAPCETDGGICGGTCNGARRDACTFPGSAVRCREAICEDGVVTLSAGCSAGRCPEPMTMECAPFVCGERSCLGGCRDDDECVGDTFCADGVCAPLRNIGVSCGRDAECNTGLCVDGVCCTSACEGQCEACDVSGFRGVCATVPSGPPRGGRPACTTDGTECGGFCGGTSRTECVFPGEASRCGVASCFDGAAQPRGSCDAAGRCITTGPESCGDFACRDGACITRCVGRADCADGNVCASGECVSFVLDDMGFTDAVDLPPGDGCGAAGGGAGAWLVLAWLWRRRRA
ncbi:MAG: hypothetical protein AAGH15_25820, partial [Myxococcota bacterium]